MCYTDMAPKVDMGWLTQKVPRFIGIPLPFSMLTLLTQLAAQAGEQCVNTGYNETAHRQHH